MDSDKRQEAWKLAQELVYLAARAHGMGMHDVDELIAVAAAAIHFGIASPFNSIIRAVGPALFEAANIPIKEVSEWVRNRTEMFREFEDGGGCSGDKVN